MLDVEPSTTGTRSFRAPLVARAIRCWRPRSTRSRRRRRRGRGQRPFRGAGRLRRGYIRGGSGCAGGRVDGDARAERSSPRDVAVRGASPRGRRPRRRERDPGSAERGVRRDQLPRDRAVSRGHGADPPGVAWTRAPRSRWSSSAARTTRRACTDRSSRRSRGSPVFARLRDAAVAARDAVLAQDLDAFGRAMIANTDAQASLHPELVGVDARRVIEIAAARSRGRMEGQRRRR